MLWKYRLKTEEKMWKVLTLGDWTTLLNPMGQQQQKKKKKKIKKHLKIG